MKFLKDFHFTRNTHRKTDTWSPSSYRSNWHKIICVFDRYFASIKFWECEGITKNPFIDLFRGERSHANSNQNSSLNLYLNLPTKRLICVIFSFFFTCLYLEYVPFHQSMLNLLSQKSNYSGSCHYFCKLGVISIYSFTARSRVMVRYWFWKGDANI